MALLTSVPGIGIGGEYPCGSTAAAESTENSGVKKNHQQRLFVWATHFMIDLGFRELRDAPQCAAVADETQPWHGESGFIPLLALPHYCV